MFSACICFWPVGVKGIRSSLLTLKTLDSVTPLLCSSMPMNLCDVCWQRLADVTLNSTERLLNMLIPTPMTEQWEYLGNIWRSISNVNTGLPSFPEQENLTLFI